MQAQSRKRPAPGTSPIPQSGPQSTSQPASARVPTVQDPSQLSDDQFLSWGQGSKVPQNDGQSYHPFPAHNGEQGSAPQGYTGSNQLVRRYQKEQGGFPTHQPVQTGQVQQFEGSRVTPALVDDSDENDGDLETRAAAVKREALSKRPPKSIPPFIQKLSSFLDDPKNSELIRWAGDGRSFIVIEEERFASELIPEMFKHNNYASFVRQLNMYGFHKKVGLSDNSMRASEKKAKLPSGYKHKYFRQGRPELLWLIEKPKPEPANKTGGKGRGTKAEPGDNGDEFGDDGDNDRGGGRHDPRDRTGLITLPKADLANVEDLQDEVKELQRSQQTIYSILAKMRDDNNQYIKQATQMVANHERHETSINAILQFLATFYNQSLQGRENMFSNAMPSQQPRGNVVEEMGDFADSPGAYSQIGRNKPQIRRPLALLPAPATPSEVADSPTKSPQPAPNQSRHSRVTPLREYRRPESAASSETSSPRTRDRPTPGNQDRTAENQDILNVINRSNAQQSSSSTPRFDFSSALRQYSQDANGKNGPLTPEQRDTMLSIMASHSGATTPGLPSTNDNPSNSDLNLGPSPYLDYFNNNQDQLELLARLQDEQNLRVQDLAGRLQPLSPSGSIPGLDTMGSGKGQAGDGQDFAGSFQPDSDPFNFDNYLNDEFLDGADGDADLNADNYNLDWSNLDGAEGGELFGDRPSTAGAEAEEADPGTGSYERRVISVPNSEGGQTPKEGNMQYAGEEAEGQSSKRRRFGRG